MSKYLFARQLLIFVVAASSHASLRAAPAGGDTDKVSFKSAFVSDTLMVFFKKADGSQFSSDYPSYWQQLSGNIEVDHKALENTSLASILPPDHPLTFKRNKASNGYSHEDYISTEKFYNSPEGKPEFIKAFEVLLTAGSFKKKVIADLTAKGFEVDPKYNEIVDVKINEKYRDIIATFSAYERSSNSKRDDHLQTKMRAVKYQVEWIHDRPPYEMLVATLMYSNPSFIAYLESKEPVLTKELKTQFETFKNGVRNRYGYYDEKQLVDPVLEAFKKVTPIHFVNFIRNDPSAAKLIADEINDQVWKKEEMRVPYISQLKNGLDQIEVVLKDFLISKPVQTNENSQAIEITQAKVDALKEQKRKLEVELLKVNELLKNLELKPQCDLVQSK